MRSLPFAFLILVAACGTESAGPEVPVATTVSITAVDTLRSIGATATLSASVKDQRDQPMPEATITWQTSNANVLAVNDGGVATAVGNGAAIVTARAGTASATRQVHVLQRPVSLTMIAPDTIRSLGATMQVQLTAKDAGGAAISTPVVDWSSTNNAIATVSSFGLAAAQDNGSVFIRVKSGALSDSAVLTVRQRASPTTSTVTVAMPMLLIGDTVRVTMVARDALDNPIKTGDLAGSITATAQAGASGLTEPPTIGAGNGPFTADFVGTGTGTPRTVRGTLNGIQVFAAPTLRVLAFTRIVANSDDAGTCGILDTADLYCWGEQNAGMRGRGVGAPAVSDPTPTLVSGGHQWASVAPEHNYMCGLTAAGKLYCWGAPGEGQLGNGIGGPLIFAPAATLPESTFTAISAHQSGGACAITTAMNTVCWGFGYAGRLGNGADTNVVRPVGVNGALKLVAVAATSQSGCGITEASAAKCWGHWMTLGAATPDTCTGPVACAKAPVTVVGGLTWKPIIVNNAEQACAIATSDKTYCWGGAAGPAELSGAPVFTSLATGNLDQCGLTAAGAMYCWGRNYSGRFGPVDFNQYVTTPVAIVSGFAFSQISLGRQHSCGITTSGGAYCWGSNTKGELGDRSTNTTTSPVRVRLFMP